MTPSVTRQMAIGERKFIKRTEVVMVEVVPNDTNNVNDARDRLTKETVLAETSIDVPAPFVAETIKKVLA